jgi:hypothetical protein
LTTARPVFPVAPTTAIIASVSAVWVEFHKSPTSFATQGKSPIGAAKIPVG